MRRCNQCDEQRPGEVLGLCVPCYQAARALGLDDPAITERTGVGPFGPHDLRMEHAVLMSRAYGLREQGDTARANDALSEAYQLALWLGWEQPG